MTKLIAERPAPGTPRPYEFPRFKREQFDSGLKVITCNVPSRPLATVMLALEAGAENEESKFAGVASLAAKSVTEGTEKLKALEFIEAAERIGADISGTADWDSFRITLRAPISRLEAALELLSDAARRPTFPEREVERLKGTAEPNQTATRRPH